LVEPQIRNEGFFEAIVYVEIIIVIFFAAFIRIHFFYFTPAFFTK